MVKYEKYKTKAGKDKWKYSGYYGFDEKTGKKLQPRGRGFNSKAEAKLDYERTVENYKNEAQQIKKQDKTFSHLLEEYLEYYKQRGIKPGTYKKFKDEMNRYAIPLLGKKYISKIDINDCQETYDMLRKKKKRSQKN